MVRLILRKGMFPTRKFRFCTESLKVETAAAYFETLDAEPLIVTGIRREESDERSDAPEWEWWKPGDCEQWRPLVEWIEQDVINIHRAHGVVPNPLYFRDATRVGCYPCIFAAKAEIRAIAHDRPNRIAAIVELERVTAALSAERAEAQGKAVRNPPTWFQAMYRPWEPVWVCAVCEYGAWGADRPDPAICWEGAKLRKADRHKAPPLPWPTVRPYACLKCDSRAFTPQIRRNSSCVPIQEVVRWANSRVVEGEFVLEPFTARPEERGCARWGMCEIKR